MTNTEFKKKIAEAKDPEWFKNISVTFNFSYINVNLKIDGLSAIYEYIKKLILNYLLNLKILKPISINLKNQLYIL
jgi:hypothetical protein